MYGPAGAGKSAIAQTIAERYSWRYTPDRGVAGHLFLTPSSYIESALKAEPLLYLVRDVT